MQTLPLCLKDEELTVLTFYPSGLQGLELACSTSANVGKKGTVF